MTAALEALRTLPTWAAFAPLITLTAASLVMPTFWAIHLGADAYETPARGLDEDGEVWHG